MGRGDSWIFDLSPDEARLLAAVVREMAEPERNAREERLNQVPWEHWPGGTARRIRSREAGEITLLLSRNGQELKIGGESAWHFILTAREARHLSGTIMEMAEAHLREVEMCESCGVPTAEDGAYLCLDCQRHEVVASWRKRTGEVAR